MPPSAPSLTMERKRATAPFATGPARRPPKDEIDSDDEPHDEHSSSSIFPPLQVFPEGEDEQMDEQVDEQIQSQLQTQEETESQRQQERQQQQQQQDGEIQPTGSLWDFMDEKERRGDSDDNEDDHENENNENENAGNYAGNAQADFVRDSPRKPPRKRQRKAAVAKPKPTAATNRSRRGKGVLGVTNVLEQMSAAMERAQLEKRAVQKERQQQQQEEAEQQQEEAAKQQQDAERQQEEAERQQEQADRQGEDEQDEREEGVEGEVDGLTEGLQQQQEDEQREEEGEEHGEEREGEGEEAAPTGTPTRPSPRRQEQETAAATPARSSKRLQGHEPTKEPDAAAGSDGAEEEAEDEANGNQPSTQRTTQTIQEAPQGTGNNGNTDVQPQGGDNDDDAPASPQISSSLSSTGPPVTAQLSTKTLKALIELMGSAGWTGKATWKMGLNWQHSDPGQFGPGPFTVQARDLLRQLAILADVYVQVPRPDSQRPNDFQNFDMRIQKQYLQDHDGDNAPLLSGIEKSVNLICLDALQPLTTYAADATREAVRFRWLLAEDLLEYVIPKAVELLETVYALGGSLPEKELGVAAVYVPRNMVQMIHATLYAVRRVAGWIIRLENALAWELGYRADRRIPGGRITYLEDDDDDNSFVQRSWNESASITEAPPVSVAAKRRDRSRLKPLLNKLEDELGLAWVYIERSRAAQQAANEAEINDDGAWMDVEAAVSQPPQTRRKKGRPRKQQEQAWESPPPQASQQQQTEPERTATPPGTQRARAALAAMADWDKSDDLNESTMYEVEADRVGESMQILLSQPPTTALEEIMEDVYEGDDDNNNDDDDDYEDDSEDDHEDDGLVMTTAIATTAAVPESSPPVASIEQVTQDMNVVEPVEEAEEVEEVEEFEEADEAQEVDGLGVDAMQVDVPVEAQAEVPVTPAADIPTPAPTPIPTPTPGPAPAAVAAPAATLQPTSAVPTTTTSAGPRAYTDAELKRILGRLRALKGTAQLDLVRLAAELGRDVFDVANRVEGIKSVVRAKVLREKKPVPHWAQAGYTIR